MGKNSKRKGKSSSQALNDTAERKNKKNLRDEQTLEETFDNLKFEDPFEVKNLYRILIGFNYIENI